MKICKMEDCNKEAKAKGLCATHYSRLIRNGTPYLDKPQYNFQAEWIEISAEKGGLCAVDGCDRKADIKGICDMHYKRLKRNGTTDKVKGTKTGYECTMEDCGNPVIAKGLCTTHYKRLKRTGTPHLTHQYETVCSVEDCEQKSHSNGYCKKHYTAYKKYGNPIYRKVEVAKGRYCLVNNCERKVHSKGICDSHYANYMKNKKKGKYAEVEEYLEFKNRQ